jgi:hypothetical protein
MTRTLMVGLMACAVAGSGVVLSGQRGAVGANPQAVLRQDVQNMTAGLRGGRIAAPQAIINAQRLATGYRSLIPLAGGFSPAEYVANRELARASLYWLGTSGVWYLHDPAAARAYLDAYDSIGGFYRNRAHLYAPAAYVAYAGGARLARRVALASSYDWSLRELDRLALAYGTLATLDGHYVGPWTQPQDLPPAAPSGGAAVSLTPVALPKVDAGVLTAAQRTEWDDVRVRFRSVSAQVHGARVLLDQLAGRLHAQGLELHPQNAATALKMQGFLEDAADLIASSEFDTATDALRRADYERGKLKGVTGQ